MSEIADINITMTREVQMHEACRWNNRRAELQLLCCGSLQAAAERLLLLRWKGRRCCSACERSPRTPVYRRSPFLPASAKGRGPQDDRSGADGQGAGEPPRHEAIPSDCCRSTTAWKQPPEREGRVIPEPGNSCPGPPLRSSSVIINQVFPPLHTRIPPNVDEQGCVLASLTEE